MKNYLAENRRRIPIIGQLSINHSVHFLGIRGHGGGSGLSFLTNLQAPADTTGWGNGHTSNHNWVEIRFGPHSMTNVAWGASVDPRLDYLQQSPVNLCTTRRPVRY